MIGVRPESSVPLNSLGAGLKWTAPLQGADHRADLWRVLEYEARLASNEPVPELDDRNLFPEKLLVIDEEQSPPLPIRYLGVIMFHILRDQSIHIRGCTQGVSFPSRRRVSEHASS